MKRIMSHISLLLISMTAAAQGPSAYCPVEQPATEIAPEALPSVQLIRLSEPVNFPEAEEYAFSVRIDPQTAQVMVRVNAAPAPAHGRITDEEGNLLFFAPVMEIDRNYLFPPLPDGHYQLRLDTEEGLPAVSYKITCM